MIKSILLCFFSCVFFIAGTTPLSAKQPAKPATANKNELQYLSKRLDVFEAQQKNSIAALKKGLDETKAELAGLKNQIAELKNQKCAVENELMGKFKGQQKGLADSKEIEHILVKYGNNPDGMPTLHYAIKQGDVNAVNLLIANGANVNSSHMDFRPQIAISALSRAAICNQFEITQILLNYGADVNFIPNEDCYYPINYATEFGSGNLVTLLIANGAKIDRIKQCRYGKEIYEDIPSWITPETPLHVASKKGNYDAVVELVNVGAEIDARIPLNGFSGHGCGETPLDYAAKILKYNDNPQNLELVKFLVEHGATRRDKKYHNQDAYTGNLCPVISGYLKSMGR